MALSFINHSLIWTWTFTLGKMNDILEAIAISIHMLLARQSLLELHLLLHLLLLVSKDRVLAVTLVSSIIDGILNFLRIWS